MPAMLVNIYKNVFWKMVEMDFYSNGNEHCWLTTKQLGMPTDKAGVSGFVINILKMF